MRKRWIDRIIAIVTAFVIAMLIVLPAPKTVYAAESVKDEKASLFEKIGAGFVALCGLGLYSLVGLVAGESMSIDKLIFNHYGNTSLSLFNGDKTIDAENEYINGYIKNTVNNFFKFFTDIAVIAYLIILVYMGIRILLGINAEKKSRYSELFLYWIQGVAILFLFPYVIKYTIFINNAFVKFIDDNKARLLNVGDSFTHPETSDNFSSMEDAVKSLTDTGEAMKNKTDYMSVMYNKAMETGWLVFAIAYFVMVMQMIGLFIVYFKRLLTVIFLVSVFPLVTVSYALDKIGDGKSQAFNNWYKEFALNVFLQSFHAIVYVIGMALILNLGNGSSPSESWFFIIIVLTFISNGDEILRNIFHMKGGGGDTVKGVGKTMLATKGAVDLANSARKTVARHTGDDSHLGKLRSNVSDISTRRISSKQSEANIKALEMARARDEQSQAAGGALAGMGMPAAMPGGAPEPTNTEPELTELQKAADVALDENASDDERSEAVLKIAEALNSENEEERDQAIKELAEHLGYEETQELLAAAGVVMAAGTLPIELEENIQVMLKLLKGNQALKGRRVPKTEEEVERLKKANKAVKPRRPQQGARKNAKKTSKANSRDRYAKQRTAAPGTPGNKKPAYEKYNGVFTIAPSTERMRRAREAVADKQARKGPRTFRQKVVSGGASAIVGAKNIGRAGKYQLKKNAARVGMMGYEGRALLDARQLLKLQKRAEKLRNSGMGGGAEYENIMSQIRKLQAPKGNLQRLQAKRASYAQKGIYFNTGGATQRYMKASAFVDHKKKAIPQRFRDSKKNFQNNRYASQKVKRAEELLKKKNLTALEQKELDSIRQFVGERKTTESVFFGRLAASNKPQYTNAQKKLKKAQRRHDDAQLKKTIRRKKVEAREEAHGNKKILRNARIEERRAFNTIVKTELKTSVRMMQDRRAGRVSDYTAENQKINDASKLLRGRGILVRPPKVSKAVSSGIRKYDDITDRSGKRASAREGYATTKRKAYNSYQTVKKNRTQAELDLAKSREDMKKARTPGEREIAKKKEEEALARLNTATNDQANIYSALKTSRQKLKTSGVRFVGVRSMGSSIIEREIEQDIQDRLADARKGERIEGNKIRILAESKNAKRQEKLAPKSSVMAEMLKERNWNIEGASGVRDSYAKENEVLLNVARNLGISTDKGATASFSEKITNLTNSAASLPSSAIDYARGTGPAVSAYASDAYSSVMGGIESGIRIAEEAPSRVVSAFRNAPENAKNKLSSMKGEMGQLSAEIMELAAKRDERVNTEKRVLKGFIMPNGESSNSAAGGVSAADGTYGSSRNDVMSTTVLFVGADDTSYHGDDQLVIYESSFGHGKSKKTTTEMINEYVDTAKNSMRTEEVGTGSDERVQKENKTRESSHSDSDEGETDAVFDKELFLLASSVCALNQAENGFYTASELITHINNIKKIQGHISLDTKKDQAIDAIVSKLNVDLGDFESDLRVKMINDPTLLDMQDKSSKKIMDSSIEFVQNMDPDNLFLANLVYTQEDLQPGHIPTPKFGGRYGMLAKEPDPEDMKVQNAFEYSLREKQRADQIAMEEKNIRSNNKAIGKDLVAAVGNAVGLAADLKIGIPLAVGAGLITTGAASGTKDGSAISLQGPMAGMGAYSLVSGAYSNVSGAVGSTAAWSGGQVKSVAEATRRKLASSNSTKKSSSSDK